MSHNSMETLWETLQCVMLGYNPHFVCSIKVFKDLSDKFPGGGGKGQACGGCLASTGLCLSPLNLGTAPHSAMDRRRRSIGNETLTIKTHKEISWGDHAAQLKWVSLQWIFIHVIISLLLHKLLILLDKLRHEVQSVLRPGDPESEDPSHVQLCQHSQNNFKVAVPGFGQTDYQGKYTKIISLIFRDWWKLLKVKYIYLLYF